MKTILKKQYHPVETERKIEPGSEHEHGIDGSKNKFTAGGEDWKGA